MTCCHILTGKLIDYSHSYYVPIEDGTIGIYQDFGYIAHYTNITNYEDIVTDTAKAADTLPDARMRQIVTDDLSTITRQILNIRTHHRQARSINMLGSALKVITGTPDFDDFEELRFAQQTLQTNNDKQVIINQQIEQKINKLTKAINDIQNSVRHSGENNAYLFNLLNNRNKVMIGELDNLSMSMILGKLGIINPIILNSEEVESVLRAEKMNEFSINEIITNSKFRIRQNNNIIEILIKYPIIYEACNKIRIFPVVHNKKILTLESNLVAKCNGNYKIVKCNSDMDPTFCRETFEHSSCLGSLLNNNSASCKSSSSHQIEQITEISDGVLLINEGFARIKELGKPPIFVNGSFLITFKDSVEVNSTLFTNKKSKVFVGPNMPSAHKVNVTGHSQALSLPYLHELHLKNLDTIASMRRSVEKHSYVFSSVIFMAVMLFISYMSYGRYKKRSEINKLVCNLKAVGTPASKEGGS